MSIDCAFIGLLTRDPELKQGKNGKSYCNFSCEVGDLRANVITFNELAEQVAKDTKRGDRLFIGGSLKLASWTNGEGEARSGLAVSATRAEKLFPAQPSFPIALPKKKRPAFGVFRKKKAHDSEDKAQDSSENGRLFDDALPF